ncbi:MAG TPA: hypothetical protein VF701_06820 [Thermoanaerobaculia bacterium]
MGAARATVDHDAIQTWVDERGGHPARVKATGSGEDPGILRIDFPGFSGEDSLEEIPWDEFFEWFDGNELALLLSEEEGNRFNKFVNRRSVATSAGATTGSGTHRGRTAGRTAASAEKEAVTRKSRSSTKRASSKASTRDTSSASRKSSSRPGASSRKSLATRTASTGGNSENGGSKRPSGTAKRSSPSRTASATKRAAASTPRPTTTKRVAGRSTVSRSASSRKK